ncbi:MAG: AgmX/PglI C-terminal domain-containing protein [Deltaproteobacteria bacterium]|nr:AgmX/PglI C-terminal domain-containing protein [Deltaproteobacteria bacterium]
MTVISCSRTKSTRADSDTYELTWTRDSSSMAPISLTASDGTGLLLQTLRANAVIQGPMAFTELHLIFENMENRVREGHFEITLPPGAAISRFAMKIGDQWQEAEVVERQKARQTYEDFLHRRQDPALLEKKAGNQFRARVFPIPALAQKEITISYSQNVHRTPYTLYVAGLPRMESFGVDVRNLSGGGEPVVYHSAAQLFKPTGNVILKPAHAKQTATGWMGLQHGNLRLVQVTPHFKESTAPFTSLSVWLDTSASRSIGFERQVERVIALMRALEKQNGRAFRLTVFCFDQTVKKIYEGTSNGFGARQKQAIVERGALGASNFSYALDWAVGSEGVQAERVLVVSDGIITAGTQTRKKLQAKISALSTKGVRRLDVLVDGGVRDEALPASLVDAGLERTGVVADAEESMQRVASRLMKMTLAEVSVQVEQADWVWPRTLHGVQSGDPQLIYIGADAAADVKVGLSGITDTPRQVHFQWVQGPLLQRASAIAQIEMVSGELDSIDDAQKRSELQQRVVALSIQHRVLSDYTGLLVLETEYDYQRYGIERTALSDILVVGPKGVERRARDDIVVPNRLQGKFDMGIVGAVEPDATVNVMGSLMGNQVGENFGYGGLAISGTARGGGGTGEGTIGLGNLNSIGHAAGGGSGAGYGRGAGGLSGRRAAAPQIRAGAAVVMGALPKEVVRRYVRRHLNEVRYCYERGLAQNHELTGRVMLKFIISSDGSVRGSTIASTDLVSSEVENCIANAARRWQFPKVNGGGVVVVNYPFQFIAPNVTGEYEPQNTRTAETETQQSETRPTPQVRNSQNLPPLFKQENGREPASALSQKSVVTAYEGQLEEVMSLVAMNQLWEAHQKALAWRAAEPKNLLALVAMGEVFEAQKKDAEAARAYGSIIDFFPSRADMRRMAGERLERLGDTAKWLVLDTYRQAVKQRPDHPAGHRLYAWALFRVGKYREAVSAMKKGVDNAYPGGRFRGVVDGMKDELKLMVSAWQVREPNSKAMKETLTSLKLSGLKTTASTRFVLHWESDANDVDLHVYDQFGNHAFYQNTDLPTGGKLLADVTTGYGPEFFTIPRTGKDRKYTMQAHYYSRGPMGYGMGTLQIITDDGNGNILFEYRPFIVMQDGAFVGLGQFKTL